jgi:hypothetical protein
MTSLTNDNRCKLLLLDVDINRLTTDDLRTFFTSYGPVEWIELFPLCSSAIIQFTSRLTVEHLVTDRTCLIGQNHIRLRRFRPDKTNWNIDCYILHITLRLTTEMNCRLTETSLVHCFRDYRSHIIKINVFPTNQALIFFSDYNFLDQILLLPTNSFKVNNESLVLKPMIRQKRSQWKQPPPPPPLPVFPKRGPVVHQLLLQIEHLSKQLRGKKLSIMIYLKSLSNFLEQPGNSRHEIERLEAEIFILKNENAQFKSKQQSSLNKNIEQRLTVLEDITNRRQRSSNNDNEENVKRRRQF